MNKKILATILLLVATLAFAADKYISSSGDIVLKTATAKKVNLNDTLYTTQAGYVQVGTTATQSKVNIGPGSLWINANTTGDGIQFDIPGSGTPGKDYQIANTGVSDTMTFGGTGVSASTKIYHNISNGKVGIGTTPLASLHLLVDSAYSPRILLSNTSAQSAFILGIPGGYYSYAFHHLTNAAFIGQSLTATPGTADYTSNKIMQWNSTGVTEFFGDTARTAGAPGKLIWEGVGTASSLTSGQGIRATVTHTHNGGYGTGFVDIKFSGLEVGGATRGYVDSRRFYRVHPTGQLAENIDLGTISNVSSCALAWVSTYVYTISCTGGLSTLGSATLWIKIVVGGAAADNTYERGISSVIYAKF